MSRNNISLLNKSSINNDAIQDDVDIIQYDAVSFHQPKINWFMDRVQSSIHTTKLNNSLMDGSSFAVGDSSFFPIERVGACAWIISSSDGSEWIEGGGVIPGSVEEQSSYSSELGGQTVIASVCTSLILPTLNGN